MVVQVQVAAGSRTPETAVAPRARAARRWTRSRPAPRATGHDRARGARPTPSAPASHDLLATPGGGGALHRRAAAIRARRGPQRSSVPSTTKRGQTTQVPVRPALLPVDHEELTVRVERPREPRRDGRPVPGRPADPAGAPPSSGTTPAAVSGRPRHRARSHCHQPSQAQAATTTTSSANRPTQRGVSSSWSTLRRYPDARGRRVARVVSWPPTRTRRVRGASLWCRRTPPSATSTGNVELVLARTREAADAGARLVVFPEMFLTGYPVEDLALRKSFIEASQRRAHRPRPAARLPPDSADTTVVVGYLDSDVDHVRPAGTSSPLPPERGGRPPVGRR